MAAEELLVDILDRWLLEPSQRQRRRLALALGELLSASPPLVAGALRHAGGAGALLQALHYLDGEETRSESLQVIPGMCDCA